MNPLFYSVFRRRLIMSRKSTFNSFKFRPWDVFEPEKCPVSPWYKHINQFFACSAFFFNFLWRSGGIKIILMFSPLRKLNLGWETWYKNYFLIGIINNGDLDNISRERKWPFGIGQQVFDPSISHKHIAVAVREQMFGNLTPFMSFKCELNEVIFEYTFQFPFMTVTK